jgi:putative serine protease XkdF
VKLVPVIKKSTELKNANISFVSLVDKAANKKKFAIIKEKNGLNFGTYAPIIKTDDEKHLVTAVVYEPMVEDTQGDYMTAEEIEKAAYSFMGNGANIDTQHDFEKAEGVTTVESWVTKEDGKIGDQEIKKGTWLITTKVEDDDIWSQIKKGDITGYSMGGIAERIDEDVDLDEVEKSISKNIFSKIAKAFGVKIEKGEMKDKYEKNIKRQNFWTAFDTLEYLLGHWDWESDEFVFEEEEQKIRDALKDFNTILTDILTKDSVTKAMGKPPEKIIKSINKEEDEVKKEDIEKMVQDVVKNEVTKAVEDALKESGDTEPNKKPGKEEGEAETEEDLTKEDVEKMVKDSVVDAVTKAMEPVLNARGISKQADTDDVNKSESEDDVWDGLL